MTQAELGRKRTDIVRNARNRAERAGLAFNLTVDDIHIPPHCPVLGVPLAVGIGRGGHSPYSPALDRIIPDLGYTKGNVEIISSRANLIKSDALVTEIIMVADYLRRRYKMEN